MKRIFDILLSLFLIIILSFPMIVIIFFIKLESKGPAIYWSKRVGKNNKLFYMPKFRSMKNNTPQLATHLLPESKQYVTHFGSFLRKNSIDEIPQLYSILIGDLSFVGPRPALFNQYDLIELRNKLDINKITPGLTGWAQVNGRDSISIEDKVDLEKEYLSKKNFLFDLYIIFLTIRIIFSKKNIKH
tara:strand:+ start:164 stop:724 length:561 start_codon:yes stop_codon:yes gene_type:complete